MKQGGIRRRVICWAWHPPICSASLSRHAIRYHLKSVWIIKWLCLHLPLLPWPRLSESLRHLELARQSNYADTWHWAMAGETFLGKLMMARGRAVEGRLWGGRQLFAPTWRRVGEQQMSRKSWPWLQMPKRAKQIDDKRKRKHSYGRGERERGGGKTPPLNILIKASSDSACKWPRQGRKWKQTAITKSKAAEGDKISRKGAALAYSKRLQRQQRQQQQQ